MEGGTRRPNGVCPDRHPPRGGLAGVAGAGELAALGRGVELMLPWSVPEPGGARHFLSPLPVVLALSPALRSRV